MSTSSLVTIVTSTYNKELYLPDAFNSLLRQTFEHWQWWLILDIPNQATMEAAYKCAVCDDRVKIFEGKDHLTREYTKVNKIARMSWIMNKYLPKIDTKFFAWLSDDDIWSPTFIEALIEKLDDTHEVAYGICQHFTQKITGEWEWFMTTGQNLVKYGPNCSTKPLCNLDGGQILQTTASYLNLGWKFPEQDVGSTSRHLDGIYLNELSKKYEFVPVNEVVLVHRATLLSEFTPAGSEATVLR